MHSRLIKNDNFDYAVHYENEKSVIKNVTEMSGIFLILGISFFLIFRPPQSFARS